MSKTLTWHISPITYKFFVSNPINIFITLSWKVHLETEFSVFPISQAPIVNNFPSKVTIVFFYIFFVTIQTTIYSLIVERNPNSWVLRPDIEMIAIVCSVRTTINLNLIVMELVSW